MRHRMSGSRRFGRRPGVRKAMLKNLATSLIMYERMQTTSAKAAEVRPMVERLISLARQDTPHHRAMANARLGNRIAVVKLFADIAPRYTNRPGGYLRILKLGPRPGDNAPMARIELV